MGVFSLEYKGVTYYFIDNEYYFKRDGLYGYFDDCERFTYFSRAVIESLLIIDFVPDIIHAIIPIFIPHLGCPHSCVFCDQNAITARKQPVSEKEITDTIEQWLSTIEGRGLDKVEISFYGGSFTAIPLELQTKYLEIGYRYVRAGRVNSLHLSTRPDYIDDEILTNLKKYEVGAVELGVQSFDDEVLEKSQRGHTADAVFDACRLISEYGFDLGIQLMFISLNIYADTSLSKKPRTLIVASSFFLSHIFTLVRL